MPKIGKNTYEFDAENTTFRVRFDHRHMRDEDGPFVITSPLGTIKAQHVTTCLFGTADMLSIGTGAMSANIGVATCSVKDTYDRRLGMKTAFERCLVAHGVEFSYYKDPTGKRTIKFRSDYDRQRYGTFMSAFFGALKPATQEPSHGKKD